MQHLLALEREAAAAVGHEALALGDADLLAEIGLAAEAVLALAAFRRVERDDMVALLQRLHLGSHVHHDAGAFMAEDRGKRALRIFTGQREPIGVAKPRGLHFHQDFAGLRAFEVHLFDAERLPGLGRQRCLGLHVAFLSPVESHAGASVWQNPAAVEKRLNLNANEKSLPSEIGLWIEVISVNNAIAPEAGRPH